MLNVYLIFILFALSFVAPFAAGVLLVVLLALIEWRVM